ncbi:MAG: hypothetical protein WC002_01830 [Candidatus Muiribacteriota bacterium]|jgi:hypothetical protein
MDKKQQIIGGFLLILLLILIFEWIIMGMIDKSFDVEGKKRILSRDIKNLMEFVPVDSMINNAEKLRREIERNLNDLKIEREMLFSNNQNYISQIKDFLDKNVINDFNFMQFDSRLNTIIREKNYDFKMGLPRQGNEEVREYATVDQNTRIRRIKVIYQPIEYTIENADFEIFGEFLREVLSYEKVIFLGDINIDRVEINDGRVNVRMEFIVIKEIKGRTRDQEVELI